MASLRTAFTQLRGRHSTSAPQWQQLRQMLQGLQISSNARHARPFSSTPSRPDGPDTFTSNDDFASQSFESTRQAVLGLGGEDIKPAAKRAPWIRRDQRAGREQWAPREFQAGRDQRGFEEGSGRFGQPDGREGPEVSGGSEDPEANGGANMAHARAMPVSPSYFSRQPEFNDSYLKLQKLFRQFSHLPTVPSDQLEKAAFKTLKDYRLSVGEEVKAAEYARCMTLVKRLHKIHPKLQPGSVKDAIAKFKRDINPHNHTAKQIPIDKFGRALGVGKRKTSTARAWVVEGTGEVLVNGKSLADAFGRVHDRESAVWALKATARTDKYNVWALVDGGGTTGQAEALAMAVGKALTAHEPALKPALRRAGVVTRDPRGVERKKHGHLKARKSSAWVKR